MPQSKNLTRRKFLASTSALLVAAQLPGQESKNVKSSLPSGNKLALAGGQRAVTKPIPKLVRWGEPERERLQALLTQDSLFFWKGPQTTLLLERFQKHYPFKHVMTCSSGTAAVHLAVAAAGIAPGDEVITAPITDMGTVIGILFQQAVPVFADLEPHTANLDPADVARRITPKTKAIIAVHLGGNPCRMAELKKLADQHHLILIEDCAQAWGALYRGQPIGTVGHIACFSLQNAKHITSGEGGVVASNDARFGPRLPLFADKGMNRLDPKAPTDLLGLNYRMSEPQAAVAAAQLTRLENIAAQRAKLGNLLTKEISGLAGLLPPQVAAADRCSFWFYLLRFQPEKFRCDREQFVKALAAEGVSCNAGYIGELIHEKPVFQQHAFFAGRWPIKEFGLTTMDYTKVTCPEASAILKTCVRLTITEAMDENYIREAAAALRKVASHFAK